MTSIFEGLPHKTRPFPIKTRVIWVPGVYIYIHIQPGSLADQTKWLIFRMIHGARIPDPTNGQSLVFGLPGYISTVFICFMDLWISKRNKFLLFSFGNNPSCRVLLQMVGFGRWVFV